MTIQAIYKTVIILFLAIAVYVSGQANTLQGNSRPLEDVPAQHEKSKPACEVVFQDEQAIDYPISGRKKSPIPGGVSKIYINQNVEGKVIDREILIHRPVNFDSTKSYPVVFAFHGNGGKNEHWPETFKQFVNAGEFIGVYPQGHLKSWNLGQERSHADEVEFVNMIVKRLKDDPNLDRNRMYAIGYSNGSALVNKLGVETAHFRAITCCACQLIKSQEPDKKTNPVSVYQLCGTADPIIPYNGGLSPVGHTFLPAKKSAERWAEQFNCNAEPEVSFIRGDSLFIYKDCESNREVRFHRVENAGHGLNQKNDPEFYTRIWDFLKTQ